MKQKRTFPILLLLTTFILSGCNSPRPSENSNQESSIDSSLNVSSEEPSSVPASSVTPTPSSNPVASSEPKPSSIERPASSSEAPVSSSEQPISSSEVISSSEAPKKEYLKKDINVELAASLREGDDLTPYTLSFAYDDELFLSDAKEYNEVLSMLSFASSIASANLEKGNAFFSDIEFDNVIAHAYDEEPTTDTAGYFFAHRTIDDQDVVAVAFRGFEYKMEWANNFLIGKSGDHEGFSDRAGEAYEDLKDYIASLNIDASHTKLWINGYSRGGALSNTLASYVMNDALYPQENVFVYTFEAPASLCEEHAIRYENVHNINNDVDLITHIPPASYGLYRCGVDYPIYDENVTTLMHEFDEAIVFPEVQTIEGFTEDPMTTDADVRDFILNNVFNKEEGEIAEDAYANTREQYVDNYQSGLAAAIGYVFALKDATRASLLDDLMNLGINAIFIIADDTGEALMEFFKPYLEQDEIAFNAESLQEECAMLIKAVQNLFAAILGLYLDDDYKNSLSRLLDMHYPETTYVLLRHAHEDVE